MKNIVTVQLQDYYQHKVFETVITKRHWTRFESRLRRNLDVTISLFDRYGIKATFFTLGWIAEMFPDMITSLEKLGHEIACAGFWGADRKAVTQADFREDMRIGKEALEYVTGKQLDGYRSIRRSFTDRELWLIDLVAEEGFRYDSSLMPIGFPGTREIAPRLPFVRESRSGPINELPHTSCSILGYRVPIGGGNFIRQLPSSFTFRAFKEWIKRDEAPFMLYFHPWELDSDIPAVSAFDGLTSLRQYRNLGKLRQTLPRYFEEAQFGTAREYLGLAPRPAASGKPTPEPSIPRFSSSSPDGRELPVTIVIPCYNEEASIGYLSRALEEMIASAGHDYALRFILVDDKSKDDTVRLLRQTFTDTDRYNILPLEQNRGVSGAICAGIEAAATEVVCSMDADCSYDPLELLKMIPMLDERTALVTASPYHPDGAVLGVPGWRLFLSRGLSGIYRLFLRHKLATYTSCFRVYRRSAMQRFKPQFGDFRGIVELLTLLDMGGEGIKEYPTTLQSRIFGYSKMKTLKTIKDHLRLLSRMGRYRAQARAMREGALGKE